MNDLAPSPAATPYRWLLALALGMHLALGGLAWFCPPALNSDSATGFLIWDAWQDGGPFNRMITADRANLARDIRIFQAWWSPGQYLVVAPWMWLGLSLGQAIAWGSFVANAASLWGYGRLFRTFGFDATTAGWAVLAIACNWTFTRPYGDFLGGELALFAVLPWLVLLTRRVLRARAGWLPWIAIPALYWLGNMAKNSFIPMAAGLVAGLRGRAWWQRVRTTRQRVAEPLQWLAWIALGHAILWASYLRLGTNPSISTGGASHPAWWVALPQLVSFPVTGVFSLGNVLGRVFLHPSHPLASSMAALWPLHLLFAGIAVALLAWLAKRETRARPDFAWLVGGVFCAYTGFFALLLVLGAAAGWEERMFKPAGLLLVAPMIAAVRTDPARWRARILALGLLAASAYGVVAALHRAHYLHALDNVGRRGISQHVLSREALHVLQALDATLPRGALIVVSSPEMALDVQRTRVLSTHAAMQEIADIAAQPHAGRVSDLVIVVNDRMRATGQAQTLARSFTSYAPDRWQVHRYGEWEFWHQGEFDRWPAAR